MFTKLINTYSKYFTFLYLTISEAEETFRQFKFGQNVFCESSPWSTAVNGPTWETPLQLPEGGEESGSVGLQLSVLPAESKLDGEPVALHNIEKWGLDLDTCHL